MRRHQRFKEVHTSVIFQLLLSSCQFLGQNSNNERVDFKRRRTRRKLWYARKNYLFHTDCTTIDWFQPWPTDALESVAEKQLSGIDFKSPALRAAIEKFMPLSFEMASQAAGRYQLEEGRYVYLTPKSYLEMLGLYQTLLHRRREENTKTA